MNTLAYTYSIVRYVHNPAAGERLNIGVILCAPDASFIGAQFDYRYERLSKAFADFDGTHYRRVLRQLETAIETMRLRSEGTLIQINEAITDTQQLGSFLLPDKDLSIELGPMLAGITTNAKTELNYIFERMIMEQYAVSRLEHRTDDIVWQSSYRPVLRKKSVTQYLQAKAFVADDYRLEFENSFKNEKWHVLQPVTMDYAKASSLQERAAKMLGNAAVLSGHPELGKLYLLLGAPHNSEHRAEYVKAKNLLHKMPIEHELVEENEAEQFAEELASYIREHRVEDPS